jgi:hypothetical protein
MEIPEADEKLTLLKDGVRIEALCTEVSNDPRHEDGILIRAMVKQGFHVGDQCWIVDADGSKIGAVVENVDQHSRESEITMAAVLP